MQCICSAKKAASALVQSRVQRKATFPVNLNLGYCTVKTVLQPTVLLSPDGEFTIFFYLFWKKKTIHV